MLVDHDNGNGDDDDGKDCYDNCGGDGEQMYSEF